MKEIHFNINWLEKAVRDCLNIPTKPLTEADIEKIKYVKISEPYNNRFSLEISTNLPPIPFVDSTGGEEWESCCVGKDNILKSIKFSSMEIVDEFGEYSYTKEQYANCSKFLQLAKRYNEYGQLNGDKTSPKVLPNIEDWYENPDNCLEEDLCLFKDVSVLRMHGVIFDNLNFLSKFKNLKVLECVDAGTPNEDTLKQLPQLQQLCVW